MEKTPLEIRNDKLGEKVVKALNRRHFEAYYMRTKQDALEKALELIPEGSVVSWGGSVTIQEMGLLDAVKKGDYSVIDRDTATNPELRMELMRQALTCDTFLSSINALSEDGQLVNIDGNGNRVAAMAFGPKSVIVVAGINKVRPTVEEALSRARNMAAPINAQRFGITSTPCAINGSCGDCIAPDCICADLVTTRISRPAGRIKVILVGESLGY